MSRGSRLQEELSRSRFESGTGTAVKQSTCSDYEGALTVSSPPPWKTLQTKTSVSSRRNTSIMTFSAFSPSFKCLSTLSTPSIDDDDDDDSISSNEAVRFSEASKNGNLVPLYRCIFSDQLTPVLAYRCLTREGDWESPSFLFESIDQELQGRYSVVGARPTMEIVAKDNKVTIMDHEEGSRTEEESSTEEDPMEIPKRIMRGWKWSRPSQSQLTGHDLPADDAFCGGWLGYFSYGTATERYALKKRLPFSCAPEDDRNLPDVHFGLYDDVIVFDHVEKKAYVIHWVRLDRYSTAEKAYNDGRKRLDILLSRVQDIDPPRLAAGYVKLHACPRGSSSSKMSSMTKEGQACKRAAMHTLVGNIFHIALSQHFQRRTLADPFEVYRALRVVNPSPYMAYLQARGCVLISSSPEILTRVKKVKGRHLIDQLEVAKQLPYFGGFGGMSFNGTMDVALALGTIVFPTSPRYDTMYSYMGRNMRREWVAHFQAGTGIVAEGEPNEGWRECENKVGALVRAIDLAESTFL
ncbi:hypothetical protein AAC387_Pa07g3910 [Persea americana]